MSAPLLFISHSSKDVAAARELRGILEQAGYSCWLAPDDVVGTDPWAEQILRAIRDSQAMLVLVSGRASASAHVAREVSLAIGRDRAVIPIHIDDTAPGGALEYHLEGLQRLDAYPPPIASHQERILRRLERVLPLGATSTSGPGSSAAGSVPTPLPAAPASGPAAPASEPAVPVPPAGRPARVRPAFTAAWGLPASLMTLVALLAIGAGVLVLQPTTASPSASPAGTSGAVGPESPASSPSPAPSEIALPSSSATHATASASASASTATSPSAPVPTKLGPTATPRRTTPPPPPPTKTPKPATPPPTPTPAPAIVPARITSHANGATFQGGSVVISWSAASGPNSVRFYGVYVGSTPPSDPCPAGSWCKEPGDDAYAASDIDLIGGIDPGQTAATIEGLPADGRTIYVRLFTKYNPATGTYAWRDYTFTSASAP